MPAKDVAVKAEYQVNRYTVTLMDGDAVFKVMEQDFGTPIDAGEAPVRTGYTFVGWEPALPETMPAKNLTLRATWERNNRIVTYLDYDEVALADHMDFVGKFPNLEELYLQGNKLTDVTCAESLPQLTKLDVTDNYITDLRPLQKLIKLQQQYT
jgi:uncharacterized repeat protein (TIGR02543 family)